MGYKPIPAGEYCGLSERSYLIILMGEAKQKLLAMKMTSCRCGSGLLAGSCCLTGNKWFKAPSIINLVRLTNIFKHTKCYLRDTNACSKKISGEHIISESVLRVVAYNKLNISGFPWIPKGEERSIGFKSLIGNCLCSDHNSWLSPLDDVAAKFFMALRDCDLNRTAPGKTFLFSGHDIERWLLKTLANMLYTRNLANEGVRLENGIFYPKVNIIAMLQDITTWPSGAGLHFIKPTDGKLLRDDHFWLVPYSVSNSAEIVGMKTSVQGLSFVFMTVASDVIRSTYLENTVYRPRQIIFNHGLFHNVIELSWADQLQHSDVELTFLATVEDHLSAGKMLPENSILKPKC